MGVKKINSFTNIGGKGFLIEVEIDSNNSLPGIDIIGLADTSIKESRDRIRTCFKNSGIKLPNKKFIVNLSPSNIKKSGSKFDLAIAMSILAKLYDNSFKLEDIIVLGEIGLDGTIKAVEGIFADVVEAHKIGYNKFIVPNDNLNQLGYIKGIKLIGVSSFKELLSYVDKGLSDRFFKTVNLDCESTCLNSYKIDMIKGNSLAKYALAVAVCGMHNLMFVGPPGTGKSILAKSIVDFLPKFEYDQMIETNKIYSIKGILGDNDDIINNRPFRSPHHTISNIGLLGGGQSVLPGEISLAHNGVLFLDELPEFGQQKLDSLRQPLEDKSVTITRVKDSINYSCNFILLAAMNPCKCGYFGSKKKECICSAASIRRYQTKITGPILDRFDMVVDIEEIGANELLNSSVGISGVDLNAKIKKGFEMQKIRYSSNSNIYNGQLSGYDIEKHIILDINVKELLNMLVDKQQFSNRSVMKLLKLSRTIADMDGSEKIEKHHLLQASGFKSLNFFL